MTGLSSSTSPHSLHHTLFSPRIPAHHPLTQPPLIASTPWQPPSGWQLASYSWPSWALPAQARPGPPPSGICMPAETAQDQSQKGCTRGLCDSVIFCSSWSARPASKASAGAKCPGTRLGLRYRVHCRPCTGSGHAACATALRLPPAGPSMCRRTAQAGAERQRGEQPDPGRGHKRQCRQ